MFQVTFLFETFSTDVTFVRFLRRVNFPMTSETVVMAKLFPADVTIVSSVFAVAVVARVGTEARCGGLAAERVALGFNTGWTSAGFSPRVDFAW